MLVVPDDGSEWTFQVGMAEQLVAHYWHCAWVDEAVSLEAAGDSTGAERAAETSLQWTGLPSVSTQKTERSQPTSEARAFANEVAITKSTPVSWWAAAQVTTCGTGEGN